MLQENAQWLTNLFTLILWWTPSADAGDKQSEECSDLQEEKLPTAKRCHWVGADTIPKSDCKLSEILGWLLCCFLWFVAGFFVVCSLLLFVVCSLLLVLFLGTYFGKQLGGHGWSFWRVRLLYGSTEDCESFHFEESSKPTGFAINLPFITSRALKIVFFQSVWVMMPAGHLIINLSHWRKRIMNISE